MKKIISLILVSICAITMLTGCGASEGKVSELKENILNKNNVSVTITNTSNLDAKSDTSEAVREEDYEYTYKFTAEYAYVLKTEYEYSKSNDDGVKNESKEEDYSEKYYDFSNNAVYSRSSKNAEFTKSTNYSSRDSLYSTMLAQIALSTFEKTEEDDNGNNINYYVNSYKNTAAKSKSNGSISSFGGGYTVKHTVYKYTRLNDAISKTNIELKSKITFETPKIEMPSV